jgi:hypothetical protein
MDAAAQLALMTKAKAVFETPGSFLSFPALSPLTFKPAQLNFSTALSDPAVGAALEDFSRAVNVCPTDPLAPADQAEYLWDHYDAWLTAMTLAHNELSGDDQAAYSAARAMLVVTDGNGIDSDSPVVVVYKQCRDAVINAQQAYTAAQLTATMSTDPKVQAAWQNTDEPRLRGALAAANNNWAAAGRKADVEAAQGVVARCEAQMPQKMWAGWRQSYTPSIDQVTDAASNASYVPSGFSPANIAAQGWTTLTLGAAEIAALSQSAPAALKSLFGAVGTSGISSISFDFRSASIVRPWFNPAMFTAKFWKFSDSTQLSDGATPAAGAWPAYISAVVFVRNVKVADAAQPAGSAAPARLLLNISPHAALSATVVAPRSIPQAIAAPRIAVRGPFGFGAELALPVPPAVRAAAVFANSGIVRPAQPVRPVIPVAQSIHPVLRLNTATYQAPPPASPPAVTPPATAPVDDSISVLAFICRALPKCPDPDPDLQW